VEEFDTDKPKQGYDGYSDEPVALSELMSEVAPYAFDDDKSKLKRKRKPKSRQINIRAILIALILLLAVLGGFAFKVLQIGNKSATPFFPVGLVYNSINPDPFIVVSDRVPVYVKPEVTSQIIDYLPIGSVHKGLVYFIEHKNNNAARWFYVEPGYGWVIEWPTAVHNRYSDQWFVERIGTLDAAIASDGNNYQNYFYRGWAFYGKKDYQSAIRDLSKAITLAPDKAELYKYRGQVYYDMKDYTNAFNDFDESIRRGNLTASVYDNRALASIWLHLSDAAIADLRKAIQLSPGYGLLYNNLGVIYHNQDNLSEAKVNYDRAIEIDPQLSLAYTNRANLARDTGDTNRTALDDYETAIKINTVDEIVYLNRGVYYGDRGNYDLAIADYTSAIRLNSNYARAYANRGNDYMNIEKYQEALADLLKAVSLDPKLDIAQYNLGIFYYNSGFYQKALDAFKKTAEVNPFFSNVQDMIRKSESKLGQ
jgi:tetratricopeptide (TPR) repeat protein